MVKYMTNILSSVIFYFNLQFGAVAKAQQKRVSTNTNYIYICNKYYIIIVLNPKKMKSYKLM